MKFVQWIKISIILVPILFFSYFGPYYFTEEESDKRMERQKEKEAKALYLPYVNEIFTTFGKEMQEKFQLAAKESFGTFKQKVEIVEMEFVADRRATIEEARALQLLIMDQFLKSIQAHEKIQPFLKERPFSQKRIRIAIEFKGPHDNYSYGNVTRIENKHERSGELELRNKLYYYAIDPYENETYKMAIEPLIEAQKNVSTDLNPRIHSETPVEIAMDPLYTTYIDDMKTNYQLLCHAIGAKEPGLAEEIGASFTLIKHMSLSEARKLLVTAADKLLETINTNNQLNPFFLEYPFPRNRLKLRIHFTKDNHSKYEDGSVNTVALENDEITYFKVIPDYGSLNPTPFYEESYLKAQNILEGKTFQKIAPIPATSPFRHPQ